MKKPLKFNLKFHQIVWILFYILIFVILLKNSYSYLDPDLGWHLKTGQEILQTQSVPHINHYNYTLLNERWVDHEWLMNALSAWSFDHWGYWSLNVFFVLLIVLVLWLLNRFIRKEVEPAPRIIWWLIPLELVALMAITPSLGVRMQEISILNFLLLLLIIFYYQKNRNYKILFWLLPLFYLWVNCHAGFLLGIGILGFYLGIKFIEKVLPKKISLAYLDRGQILSWPQIFIFAGFSLAAITVTFFTPYGLELYSFLSTYTNTFYLTHIAEWLPQWSYPYQYGQILYIDIVLIALITTLWQIIKKKGVIKVNLWEIALVMLMTYFGFKSRRHVPLLMVASLPFLIKFLINAFDFKLTETVTKKNNYITTLTNVYIIAVFIIASAGQIIATKFTSQPFTNFCDNYQPRTRSIDSLYPCGAIEFLKSHPEYNNQKILNPYGWGGFMIWAYPEKLLFIDGRLPQTKYGHQTFLEEYNDFFDPGKIDQKITTHDIGLVLLNTGPKPKKISWYEKTFLFVRSENINHSKNPLLWYFENNPRWEIIHQTNLSTIYAEKQN